MNDEIKIDKGIPLPMLSTRSGSVGRIFQTMQNGDSFLTRQKIAALYGRARMFGCKICVRKTDNPGEFRVWRINDNPNPPSGSGLL